MKRGLQSVFGAALSVLCLGQATAGIVPARAGETTLPADAGKVMISRVAADVFAQSGLLASTAEWAQRKFLSASGEVISLLGQAEYSALNAEQRAALVGRIRGALNTAETVVMAPVYAAAKTNQTSRK